MLSDYGAGIANIETHAALSTSASIKIDPLNPGPRFVQDNLCSLEALYTVHPSSKIRPAEALMSLLEYFLALYMISSCKTSKHLYR